MSQSVGHNIPSGFWYAYCPHRHLITSSDPQRRERPRQHRPSLASRTAFTVLNNKFARRQRGSGFASTRKWVRRDFWTGGDVSSLPEGARFQDADHVLTDVMAPDLLRRTAHCPPPRWNPQRSDENGRDVHPRSVQRHTF